LFFPKEQNVLDQYNLAKNVLDQFFSQKEKNTKHSSREAKDLFHALKVEIPAQRHKTENTHNMGVSILCI